MRNNQAFSVILDCPKCRCSTFVDLNDHKDMKLLMFLSTAAITYGARAANDTSSLGARYPAFLRRVTGARRPDELWGWQYCPGWCHEWKDQHRYT
ncbi:hypothetical protein JB92DRAFT_1230210 [Gautieria morchelliformis]|nr:hypothetical protein JB92DRAFT_1230210 [Gautieria morchelliformis]